MGKKVELAVNEGSAYGQVTEFMRKKQVYTKTDLVNFLMENGKSEKAALSTAQVMLSPRESSTRGDCRGNRSNPWGHLAYNDKLNRKVDKATGEKEEQKFRFRFRTEALEPRKRTDNLKVEGEKVETSPVEFEVTETSEVAETAE